MEHLRVQALLSGQIDVAGNINVDDIETIRAIREQATIGTALEALSRFIHIHNEGMRLAITRREGLATVTFMIRGAAMRQATELALATVNRALGFLCAGSWRPHSR